MVRLHGNETKINACMIRENPVLWEKEIHYTKEFTENLLAGLESMLSTRLSDETFRGIINFERATITGTPISAVEKALVS